MGKWALLFISLLSLMEASFAQEQCGKQAGGALCPGGLCCSEWGYCGSTSGYCGDGCQSQCPGGSPPPPPPPSPSTPAPPPPSPSGGGGDVSSIISKSLFEEMLKHRNDNACSGKGNYTYEIFISATHSFPAFGTTGDTETRQREIAAFFGQTSQETTGGWPDAPGGPYTWGYCFVEEQNNPGDYCSASVEWPCAAGKKYFGRGPIQLTHNYNYGPAGEALNYDLLNYPEALATDMTLSFQAALWFWMTPQYSKPSCHDVITNQWTPSSADTAAGRVPGYGVITNIINGGMECGKGYNERVEGRIRFYERYCNLMGIEVGDNLDCYTQRPFNEQVSALSS